MVLIAALLPAAAAAAADFSVAPSSVKNGGTVVNTGATITFEATPSQSTDGWDLDGDGAGDKTGSVVQWRYGTPGPVTVTLYAPDGPVSKQIQVLGPSALFVSFPPAPLAGQQVRFVYTQHEDVDTIEWDLNADGQFGDVKGAVATTTFPTPGTYAVSLRVTNLDDPPARSTSTQLIPVSAAPPLVKLTATAKLRLISPFPIVRITGKVSRRGARIKRFTVQAPFGSTLKVSCRGRGCPFRRSTKTLASTGSTKSPAKTVMIRRLQQRLLYGGASVKVLVSRPGEIGKYTRFKIRRGKPPQRSDSCLRPGSTAPVQCPST